MKKKIDKELQKAALNPLVNPKMEGLEDTFRIRAGDWRVIYEVDDAEITVTVIKVGPRGDVYKGG